ncbi:hypothetical protein, conserved [Trypanosoma brucei brucei TREU927]|uniref:Leucine-rich repeat protein (LRRP) n=1 Tax=Trypanosoma brucei brucei (strain 927/4 GUTat10.1) TaxID=185431 RepID=Q57XU4_TRYB2|nr:hypothetical protein, conserved [Trypanosoma brucei brucei TREU927]AAX69575.1 hypothetical protein, conserved [Trypanosoma brucei]AAZ12785.1 hypothetical protein, conserved [Trypanosoma brucei brucei TREU927]
MGIGQSRELLGKVGEEHVFVCTNYEELLATLRKLQSCSELRSSQGAVKFEGSLPTVANSGTPTQWEETKCRPVSKGSCTLLGSGVYRGSLRFLPPSFLTDTTAKPLEEVHIPNHYMGDAGLISGHEAVLQTLANSPGLRSLNISYNALTHVSIEALLGKAPHNGAHDDNGFPGGFLPPNLLSLNFAGNRAGRVGCERLAEFLETDPPLRALSLYNNELYDDDVEPLLRGLRVNTRLRQLNLDCNYLTGGFLQQLIDVLRVNRQLAVVMFDGPYDMNTFARLKELKPVEAVPDKAEDPAGHARALLRNEMLCHDLAGRPPFPTDLVQEVEAILKPRCARYVDELREERERAYQEAKNTDEMLEVARRYRDASCDTCGGEATDLSHQEECDSADKSKSDNGTQGPQEEEDRDEDGEREQGTEGEEKQEEIETGAGNRDGGFGFFRPPLRGKDASRNGSVAPVAAPLSCLRPMPPYAERKRQSATFFPGLLLSPVEGGSSASHSMLSNTEARRDKSPASGEHRMEETGRTTANSKSSVLPRKELTNGFDRLVLAPLSEAPRSKTIWKTVTGPPCRLRACWCDARADIVPYANVLHYHCKHEQLTNEAGYEMEPCRLTTGKSSVSRGRPGRLPLKEKKGSGPEWSHTSRATIRPHSGRDCATPSAGGYAGSGPSGRTVYEGCKATSHRCESIGFYGRPKPDRRSVVFFSGQHPMLARGLKE